MDIEVMATSAVKTSIGMTDVLATYISERDKEPIWDGNIHVFLNKSKSVAAHKGRVPVQVKGKMSEDSTKSSISHSIRVTDLRSYLIDGGTIYFVVYISETTKDTKVYFASLLPYVLKQLLSHAGEQQTISVTLKAFPEDNTDKVDLFYNFLLDREQQRVIGGLDKLYTYEELTKMGQLTELSLGFTSTRRSGHPFDYLFNHELYLYATMPIGIKIPIDHFDELESASTTIALPVSSNGIQHYESYDIVLKKELGELRFGKSFVFEFCRQDSTCVLKFNLRGTLRERIRDEAFLIDLLRTGQAKIGDIRLPVKPDFHSELKSFNITERQAHLDHLRNVRCALDAAGVKGDLECTALTETDESNIRLLITAFVQHETVSFGANADIPLIGKMTIENLGILLVSRKQEDGRYLLSNYFAERMSMRMKDADKTYDVTQFVIMNKENFLQLSNIDYDSIYDDIVSRSASLVHYNCVNQIVLAMLEAYDDGGRKNQELLDAAVSTSEWLLLMCQEDRSPIWLLNYMQAIKRRRPYTGEDKERLRQLLEDEAITDEGLTGAHILLENNDKARIHFEKLTSEQRANFEQYPIMNLWIGK